ncbi:hypothetical protein TNCV_3411311 [Trichonephila clavipes]|nr:hypothetical protein TNCV_3411311 [Trichonephila clavipes]
MSSNRLIIRHFFLRQQLGVIFTAIRRAISLPEILILHRQHALYYSDTPPLRLPACLLIREVYEVSVQDSTVPIQNTALIRCHVPSSVSSYVQVSAWLTDDGLTILAHDDHVNINVHYKHLHNSRASDSRLEGLGSMPDAIKDPPSTHGFTCRNCGGGDRGRFAIYRPFGEFRRAKSYCHLYGAQGQRQAYLLPMIR